MDNGNDVKIGGVIPPIITPLNENGTIDEDGLKKVIDHCINGGVHGIFVMGSAGETMNVTQHERNRAIEITIEHAGNRVPVFCGVFDTCTTKVIENIKAAEQSGAKIVVITPTFYLGNSTQLEIIRHFENICNSTNLKVLSYNIPGMTHVNISPETVFELSGMDNLVGHKESYGNWEQFQKLLFMFEGTDFSLLQGAEELIGVSMLYGVKGFIPSGGNFYPKLYVKMYESGLDKKVNIVYEYQKLINVIGDAVCAGLSWMAGLKYIGELMGLCKGTVSLPVEPLTDLEKIKIKKILNDLNNKISKFYPELT